MPFDRQRVEMRNILKKFIGFTRGSDKSGAKEKVKLLRTFSHGLPTVSSIGVSDMSIFYGLVSGDPDSFFVYNYGEKDESTSEYSDFINDCSVANIDFKYIKIDGDDYIADITSDLVFVDNRFSYDKLKRVLEDFSKSVSKYILINNTEINRRGTEVAIHDFLNENNTDWNLHKHFSVGVDGGLTCLIRRRLESPKTPKDTGLRILAVPSPDACGVYRLIQPFTELCHNYPDLFVSTRFFDLNKQKPTILEIKDSDIVVIQRATPHEPNRILEVLHIARSLGKMVIYDIDDYWGVPKWNPAYRLWTDTKLEYFIKEAIRLSTVVTCTTSRFKEEIERYTDRPTYVVRNAINKKLGCWNMEKSESDLVRIGWVGGIHHMRDIEQIKGLGKWIVETFENTSLTLVGYKKKGNYVHGRAKDHGGLEAQGLREKELSKHTIVHEMYAKLLFDEIEDLGKTPLQYSSDRFNMLEGDSPFNYGRFFKDFDIVIAVLEDNPFNGMKSEIKLAEAVAYKCAFICTDMRPYNEWVENGKNGYVCKTIDDWKTNLSKLIKNKEHRERLAQNLYDGYGDMFDIVTQNEVLKDIIEDNYDDRFQFTLTRGGLE